MRVSPERIPIKTYLIWKLELVEIKIAILDPKIFPMLNWTVLEDWIRDERRCSQLANFSTDQKLTKWYLCNFQSSNCSQPSRPSQFNKLRDVSDCFEQREHIWIRINKNWKWDWFLPSRNLHPQLSRFVLREAWMLKDERYFAHMSGRTHVTGHFMCNGFVVSRSIQQNTFSSCHSNPDSLRLD